VAEKGSFSVVHANSRDLSLTTYGESAAIHSGATDALRPAGLIRVYRVPLSCPMLPVADVDATSVPLNPTGHG
jgi:hypothetical protein